MAFTKCSVLVTLRVCSATVYTPLGSPRRSQEIIIHLKILLVEPDYYTRYPPLGLLKLAALHKAKGDKVALVRGKATTTFVPNRIYVTSLFTWDWPTVWEAVHFYKKQYPKAELQLGGIYASLLPQHAALSGADSVREGLLPETELLIPDYSLVPNWPSTLLFATRGCTRKCGFCSVPKLEGPLVPVHNSIQKNIYPGHRKVVFFDNNILGSPTWRDIFAELAALKVEVDFNQGMDARYVTPEVGVALSRLHCPIKRLAYDYVAIRPHVERAIGLLISEGIPGKKIVFYVLYNYIESPDEFFHKVRDLLTWGVVAYPMRYEPLCALEKSKYVAPKWSQEELEMVQRARRVIGFGGAFPPYKGLVEKFLRANDFRAALSLKPRNRDWSIPRPILEMAAEHEQLTSKASGGSKIGG